MQFSSTSVRKRGHVYFVYDFRIFVYIFLRFPQEVMKYIYIYIRPCFSALVPRRRHISFTLARVARPSWTIDTILK